MILAAIGLVLALIPALTFARNFREFSRLPAGSGDMPRREAVSVLIPARDEQDSIRASIDSVLASRGVEFELIVLDDHSSDDTAAIVARAARSDPRLKLAVAPPLPGGWCGKQHACQVLAGLARHDLLVWLDADVRLAPDALSRIADEMRRAPIGLLSGFPREETEGWMEILLIPLIHFILLGYLPLQIARRSRAPAFGAGCGQLFIARRAAYEAAGGHGAIRASLHDGIALPRAFRQAGQTTDLFDATDLAACRMYRSAGDVWHGLLKNAGEGMATPAGIVPWTFLLVGGQVLPPVLAIVLIAGQPGDTLTRAAIAISLVATGLGFAVRFVSAWRYRQSWLGAALHPLGVAALLAVQWTSLFARLSGTKRAWKGRTYD